MKKRRIVALLLAAVMALTTAAFAETAPAADQELRDITAKVKAALDLDTEVFTDFSGWSDEDVANGKRWNLEWSGDGVFLSILAGADGKIYNYNYSESASETEPYYVRNGLTIPLLPEDKTQSAYQAALNFTAKVVTLDGESVALENDVNPSLTATTYRFQGEIQVNGLSTPIGCSVTVRASDLKITRFRRDDAYSEYVGTPNATSTKITEEAARRMLRSTLELEARYVLGEDGVTARVMYVPTGGDEYYVDGATGELVNLTELQTRMWLKNSNRYFGITEDSAASDMAAGKPLSKAELEGAAKLAGAKEKEELDRMLKNTWPEIGLTNYTLSSFSYNVGKTDEETGETPVTASMTYSRQAGEEMIYKYLRLDAKSGKLENLYTHRGSMRNSESTVKYSYNTSLSAAQTTAEQVLQIFAGKNYSALGLKTTQDGRNGKTWEHTFRFEQEKGGYFYPDNNYVVGIDTADGTLTQLSGAFDEAVVLSEPKGYVLTLQQAKEAYEGALTAKFAYVGVPVNVTQGEYYSKELKELGYEYRVALRCGWGLTQGEKRVRMVDAQTGEALYDESEDFDWGVHYADLEGHWVKTAADALGRYGVGLYTENLVPEKALTQLELVALLSSVEGYCFNLEEVKTNAEEQNELYNAGYRLGLVTPETRQPEKVITRGELVKVLLDAAGYQEIAALSGIFKTQFADQEQIPAGELGYAALAQGLGLVNGGSGKLYAGERTATRSEAVAMLYQYMNR